MNQRSEFPVREDSPKREKQEEKGRSAQEQRTEFPVCENSRRRETRSVLPRGAWPLLGPLIEQGLEPAAEAMSSNS